VTFAGIERRQRRWIPACAGMTETGATVGGHRQNALLSVIAAVASAISVP
jgi:hypothetical protein